MNSMPLLLSNQGENSQNFLQPNKVYQNLPDIEVYKNIPFPIIRVVKILLNIQKYNVTCNMMNLSCLWQLWNNKKSLKIICQLEVIDFHHDYLNEHYFFHNHNKYIHYKRNFGQFLLLSIQELQI